MCGLRPAYLAAARAVPGSAPPAARATLPPAAERCRGLSESRLQLLAVGAIGQSPRHRLHVRSGLLSVRNPPPHLSAATVPLSSAVAPLHRNAPHADQQPPEPPPALRVLPRSVHHGRRLPPTARGGKAVRAR